MRPQSASALLRGPPLSICDVIKMGYLQQVRDLVDFGMDIDCKDVDGKTPLMLCAFLEPTTWGVGIARHLIELGATLNLRDKSGRNSLHYTCIYERYKLANVILRAIDFDLNQRDRYGNTALHYAVKSGNMDMVALIVSYLRRYSMTLDNRNKEGLSAVDIAHELFDTKCLQLLEEREKGSKDSDEKQKQENNQDKIDAESQAHEHSERKNSGTYPNEKAWVETDESAVPEQIPRRPATALLKRRRTSSSSSTSTLSSEGRSKTTLSMKRTPGRKTPRHSSRTGEKTPDEIIKCVSLSDFRNTKEYVFKLTALPYDELEPNGGLPSIRRPQSAWTPRCESYHDQQPFSWRKEFNRLYVEYEFQCSPSWRDAAKTLADQIAAVPCPPTEDETDEKVRDRRGRRLSVTQKGLTVESIKDKRRSSGNIKLRKGSSHNTTSHKLGQDGALASSSESLSSGSSSKKRDSVIPKPEVTSPRNVPPVEKEPPVRGPTSASTLPIPAVTETLVGDKENVDDTTGEDAVADSTKLYVLSDIDE